MKRNIREAVKKVIGVSMLSVAVLSTISMMTYAANFGWSGYAAAPGSTIEPDPQSKLTTSSVIVNYSGGSSDVIGVSIWASWKFTNFTDVTLYTAAHPSYYLNRDSSYYAEVLNTAHEQYGDCYVKPKFVASAAGNHAGRWRPDVNR